MFSLLHVHNIILGKRYPLAIFVDVTMVLIVNPIVLVPGLVELPFCEDHVSGRGSKTRYGPKLMRARKAINKSKRSTT
ncbi:hypothetical protein BU26DRAFT_71016 [Trematosphaeria pertusa]|uniref:Uncharacterized protein n=1 Tax=Trematosphaeria pertusa TaxID=390896 RepID=A0A6A6I4T8_9PLEO|nr:uncharacterized protein BU26DRAFT_71016 [Trematosphaeria pertusa]KAF2245544.1 hypothetical protein BU26DRAFT_71016 [Trematosphaeria pertusa]